MTNPVQNWNMTPNRFKKIAKEFLSDELLEELDSLFYLYDRQERLDQYFNSRTLSQSEKTQIARNMARVFLESQSWAEADRIGFARIFSISACITHPGAFELWLKSPLHLKTSRNIYKMTNMHHPRSVYAWLQLLEKTGFSEVLDRSTAFSMSDLVSLADQNIPETNISFDFSEPNDRVKELVRSSRLFVSFGFPKDIIAALAYIIYGAEKFENITSDFSSSNIFIYPDELVKVFDLYDEFGQYPATWIKEVLSLETMNQ